jgi:hypothetical protein
VRAAVAQDGFALLYASTGLWGDREVVRVAVAQNVFALRYASTGLRGDREVVRAAVAQNGFALMHASEELRGDREVVCAAVAQDGFALEYASEELKRQYGSTPVEFLANVQRAASADAASADVVEVAAPARTIDTIVLSSDEEGTDDRDQLPPQDYPPERPRKRRRAQAAPCLSAQTQTRTQAGAGAAAQVKVERDGGWPAEFQEVRQRPFDAGEYERLAAFFLAPGGRAVPRGGRVTRSREDETARLAEWPRLNQAVRAMHGAGEREEALKHLRCVEEYMKRVNHATLPRIMRRDGEMAGFVDGEEVDLVDDSDEEAGGLGVIDVEALEAMLIGGINGGGEAAAPSVATAMGGAMTRIKLELTRQ